LDRGSESTNEADLVAAFGAARARALSTIADACARAHRDPDEVTLLAVSKTVPAERLRAAARAGLTLLGENRVQEAETKAPQLAAAGVDVRWHLIGPLQSNKARRAGELFDVIQSVDSLELARRLDRIAGELDRPPLGVYLQVNVDRDEAKSGFDPEALARAVPEVAALPNLRLLGLMTVGRLVDSAEEARPTFRRLRQLSERLRGIDRALGPGLSMGMSTDYPVAIEEGATLVRVGRELFGARPQAVSGR
jgi:pyridoxal phosphate enzyme (YggS family)